ncbi:transcriptional repressor p66-alpha-like [Pimephales promelas]|uniref:transcriptional repressor p66-alpha-like n=1 Tax=Pimephales promelas TaxID=90988 RepID=UPI0019554B6B|nr:transcriptional repressor p66-alpha-like [Pimephales promelas]
MSEEAVRQTRSQKRALEKDSLPVDSKRLKRDEDEELMKASVKLELRAGDEAVGERNTAMRSVRSPSPDDVIVVSDEDPSPRVAGSRCRELVPDQLMRSSAEERECVINQLKEELRLEEAKLILLKKIRHSQTHPDSSGQKPVISVSAVLPPLLKSSATAKPAQPVVPARPSGTVAPPPLVRSGHVTKHTQVIMPALVRGAQSLSVTPQGPPALLHCSAQGQRPLQPGLVRTASVPSASFLLINQPAGSSLQTASGECVASVKLALRKQLENALLEIPPAKPPAAQLTFMPSAASLHFLYLLGLEEVVQCLLESLGPGQQGVSAGRGVSAEPSCCRQCETDFTSRWCEDGGGAVMCEQCLSANQKQALKTQHTNRLKAAFVKALQQEQEIEQRIQKTTSSSSHGGKMSRPPAAIKQVCPSSRGLPASGIRSISSPSPRLQPGQHAVRQGSEVIKSRDPTTSGWRKRSRGAAAGVTMAYMKPSLSGHKSSSALERHREFLLDMIPSHTVSHTANSWK